MRTIEESLREIEKTDIEKARLTAQLKFVFSVLYWKIRGIPKQSKFRQALDKLCNELKK